LKPATADWIELAKRDFSAAKKLVDDEYLSNVCLFHCQQTIEKLFKAILEEHKIKIPVVARALGNHQEETWQIFREHGVHVVTSASTEQAIDELSRLLKGAN